MRKNSSRQWLIAASLAGLSTWAQAQGMSLSSQQDAQLRAALQQKLPNAAMNAALTEAAPVIHDFVAANACIPRYDGSVLNRYAAPGKVYPTHNYINSPMPQMRAHPTSSCVSVWRIQGWTMPTQNALRFEVTYGSEISGQSIKVGHEVMKQANGEWLFSR
jgi:hypothetical protein